MVANAGVVVMKPLLQSRGNRSPIPFIRLTRSPCLASANDFDWLMGVNTRGVMLCFKYAAQQMIKQGRGGKIIGQLPLLKTLPSPNFICDR